MKLYLANGQYVGTQSEARKIDKGFEQVEVPTDKEGLIAYLNGWCNTHLGWAIVEDSRSVADIETAPFEMPEGYVVHNLANDPRETPAEEALRGQGFNPVRSINIEEEIASADFPTALRLAEHATARVGEHLREIADARFPKPAHRYTKLEDLLS